MSSLKNIQNALEKSQKDACGVGFIAAINSKASHFIVEKGLEAIASMQHRGGVGSDGKTGDGAGIKTQLPVKFFTKEYHKLSNLKLSSPTLAVGSFFLPIKQGLQKKIREIIEKTLNQEFGYKNLQWRNVPIECSILGKQAKKSRPEIKQLIIPGKNNQTIKQFEKDLYIARRIIENKIYSKKLSDKGANTFYVLSMSSHTIVYKGLSLATELGDFYYDLRNKDYESNYSLFHQRFSTNTTPVWERAHPYRFLAHNGEINSLRGNVDNISCLDQIIHTPMAIKQVIFCQSYNQEAQIQLISIM